MVVDDHPMWRDGVRADLERDGTARVVAEASDGGEAIELARESMPELVVMDLNLPDFSGYELLTKMAETEEISFPPVIVYTGRTLTGDEEGPSDGQSQGKDRERE